MCADRLGLPEWGIFDRRTDGRGLRLGGGCQPGATGPAPRLTAPSRPPWPRPGHGCRIGVRVDDVPHSYRIDRVLVSENRWTGLNLLGGHAVVERVVVRDGVIVPGRDVSGWGVGVDTGAKLAIRQLTIERATGRGMMVVGTNSEVTLEGLLVRDTSPSERDEQGECLLVGVQASWPRTWS